MSSHFVVKCRSCGTVIRQCRCPGPKVTKWSYCRSCEREPNPPQDPDPKFHDSNHWDTTNRRR